MLFIERMKGSEPDLVCVRGFQFQTLIDQRLGSLRDGNPPGSEWAASGRYRVCVGLEPHIPQRREVEDLFMHVLGVDEAIDVFRFVVRRVGTCAGVGVTC